MSQSRLVSFWESRVINVYVSVGIAIGTVMEISVPSPEMKQTTNERLGRAIVPWINDGLGGGLARLKA